MNRSDAGLGRAVGQQSFPLGGALKNLVVIPTYNEAENIDAMLDRLLALPIDTEILVVDDSSSDGTDKMVLVKAQDFPGRVHLLSRPVKDGLGAAYLAGFHWALDSGEYESVVQMDADFSHDPADVPRLVAYLEDADLVIGSRYVQGGGVTDWSLGREALSKWGNAYSRAVLGVRVRDLTGGFKAWRTSLLSDLNWVACNANGYGFQIQTTVIALSLGARVMEIPIIFRDRQYGASKMHGKIVTEALAGVWKLRRDFKIPQADAVTLRGESPR